MSRPTRWFTPGDPGPEAHYPCVLKPLDLSASRGVIRANDPHEFAAAYQRIRKHVRARNPYWSRILFPAANSLWKGF